MKTSKNGIDLIAEFEGFSAKPYLCPARIPTIGFGATHYVNKRKVTLKDKAITREEAIELLKAMLIDYEKSVIRNVKVKLNQNQFDALVSFVYNLGEANFKSSTLLRKINENQNDVSIKKEFLRWNKAGGKVLNGLTRRRQREAELYFKK